ncbi:MAG: hypothetical protein ACE5G2_11585 [Candidatus Krumholzibacteriia bacterium]
MKLRVFALLVATLALWASSTLAQDGSIDIVFDAAGATCSGDITPPVPATLYIIARLGGQTVDGITGAEFSISGFPAGWFAISTPVPANSIPLGDPFIAAGDTTGGANIAFPCVTDPGTGFVTLYSVNVIPTVPVTDTFLIVGGKLPPTNPLFTCQLVNLCDDPQFTKVCVLGGQAFINPTGPACEVAVAERTWGEIKNLYAH